MSNRLLNLLAFFILSIFSDAQTISVSSFKLLDTDLTANTAGTMEQDQNGETAALIKVVTTQTDFTFDSGALGIVKTKQTPGEIWVYIPRGAQKMTVKHPNLGVLRDYFFPCSIEPGRTYEMTLVTGEVQTIVKESKQSQFIVIKVTPTNALVELDNEMLPNIDGVAQKFVKLGTYEYRVQAQNYHTFAGKVVVDDAKNKKIINVDLEPAFGWIEIEKSELTDGAQVFVDNTLIGTAPLKSNELPSGQHSIRIIKPLYLPYTKIVNIQDNTVTKVVPILPADYSTVTLNVDNEAEIFINGEKKGISTWTGKLGSGTYIFEARKDNHKATVIERNINSSQIQEIIQIPSPSPIFGEVKINTTPSLADVLIDGKMVGQTPLYIPELLIGGHALEIKHKDYIDYSSTFVVKENFQTDLDIKLEKGIDIKIECNVASAILYIDDILVRKEEGYKNLKLGKHTIKARCEGYKEYSSNVEITPSSKAIFINLERINNVEIETNVPSPNIFINGNKKSNSNNCRFSLEPGEYKIKISYTGYKDLEKTIKVTDKYKKYVFTLKEEKTKTTKNDWQFVRVTENSSETNGLTYIGTVSGSSGWSGVAYSTGYKNASNSMKKKAAKMGGRLVLITSSSSDFGIKLKGNVYK